MVTQEDIAPLLGKESQPIEFSAGLIGLEEWQRFVVLSHPAGEELSLLQSLEDERVSFVVTNPHRLIPDYRLALTKTDVQSLSYSGSPGVVPPDADEIGVYCILSVQEEPFYVTANLLGPLVINWKTGLGVQVILADSSYSPRHLVAKQSGADASLSDKKEGA